MVKVGMLEVWRRRTACWCVLVVAGGFALAQPYGEAPALADLVASGSLPPVEERLPQDPLVVEVVDQIGEYGGVWRRAFLGPSDANNYVRVVYDGLVRFSPDGSSVEPHIVSSWESSEDFTTWTLHLRPGARWSDGAPFTSDDIVFWYEDTLLNEELTPAIETWMLNRDGSVATVEAIDEYTVRYTFSNPNTLFLTELANQDGADRRLAAFLPAHYLRQFHPSHAESEGVEDLQALVEEGGFESWTELFMARATPAENPERPTMAAWVPFESTVADQVFTLRRNPYYIGVDAEGNQLPYIDEVQFRFFADIEALNFAAVSGAFDFQARHIQMTNYPVLIDNQERGNYRVVTWPAFGGSDAAITLNQTYEADPGLGEILRNVDFRRALSHAINRDEIRESAFLGLGEFRQSVPAPWHPYYPGDEWAFKYTEFDVDLANELLDGIGLTERDAEGYRTLPDGSPLRLELSVVPAFGEWVDVGQLVVQDWENVGLRSFLEVRERSLHFTMRESNELIAEIWNNTNTGFPFTGNPRMDPRRAAATAFASVPFRRWFETDGEEGTEPPDDLKRLVALMDEAPTVGDAERAELARELFEIWVDNLWEIGTIGLSPMVQGVIVVHEDLRNVPEIAGNDWPLRTPGNTRPEQFFFAQP